MTVREMALPNGKHTDGADPTRVSTRTRAHARLPDDTANGILRAVAATVWGDLTGSWIVADSTPSLRSYLAGAKSRPAPYNNEWLRRLRLGWDHSIGAAGTLLGHTIAHTFQHPVRALVALVAVGGPLLIWQLTS